MLIMTTAIAALAALVAIVSAAPGGIPASVPINCAKPNANYCMSGDIILRCDANAIGTRSTCADDVARYASTGGIASCYQTSLEAGDAACQMNCVVYAAQPFTLAADKCTPKASTVASSQTASQTSSQTGSSTIFAVPSMSSGPASSSTTTQSVITETGILTIPEGTTSLGSATTPTTAAASSSTTTDDCHVPTMKPTTTESLQSSAITTATATTIPSNIPSTTSTAAANANEAAGALAAAGIIAALLL